MRKRMTSLLLTLAMLLSLVPAMGVTASAGEMLPFHEVGTYQELIDAVHSGKPRIKLKNDINTRDVYASGIGIPEDKMITIGYDAAITLDLNGCTLALETLVRGGFSFFTVYGELEIKDSSPSQNGKITGKFPSVLASLFRTQGGTLTLQSGTLMTSSNKNDVITVGSSGGHVVINGGRICSGKWDTSSASPCGYAVLAVTDFADVEKMEVIINGGVFDGAVGFFPRSEFTCKEPRFHIYGGTFKQDVLLRCGQKTFKTHSPILEICGGSFEGGLKIYDWGMDPIDRYGDAAQSYPPFKLLGGTFSCTVDLCYEKSYWGFDSPKLDQFIGALKYERMRPVFAAMLENSAIVKPSDTYTAVNIDKGMDWALREGYGTYYQMLLKGTAANPVRIIPNAWGMKSVTLDGNPINYAKDWYGAVEEMDNSTAHTLKFEWYPLAQELKDAGYSYLTKCEHYISGSTAVQQTDTIAADKTLHTITIEKGADPKVYSYDLQLNLQKDGSFVGIFSNEHIVKLVVNQAPVVEPDPTIEGSVYYTSGIVFGSPISIAASNLPDGLDSNKLRYQWQRRTNDGEWTDIDGATSGKYTPVAADMGDTVRIRVKVTAEGYLGEIVGAPVKVSKAANNGYPEVIKLEAVQDGAGTYTGFEITNFDSDCEYVYSTTSTQDWNANQITSATVTGLTSDTTYYVFARFKETATHTAGSIVSKNSIKLYENVPLQYVLLEGYDSGQKIYIKQGESVTLKVSADPSNANSWNEITFKDSSTTGTSNITISNEKIAASGTTATAFPNDHSITITGVSTGSATLDASYSGPTLPYYGRWDVVVYDDSTVADALRLENVYTYADITLSENDEADLPIELPKLLPENSGYHLEWRILKRGTTGFAHVTENDNIKLENGKIKPKAAHAASEKTQLELVAVKDGSDTYKTLPKTSLFYVTVTAAPVIELTGLTVAPAKVNLELNATYQLSAVKEPVNAAGSLNWTSDKPAVAEVDNTGKVTAKAQGTAIITVTCGTKSASCTVTVGHTHDTDAQPWVYMDPGTHIKTCTAGDDFKVEAHDFGNWTPNSDNTTHSRTCSKCKKSGETAHYTETANHNWQWVVKTAATPNADGKQHEECVDCHAVKTGSETVIPMLTSIKVENLTVAKPVKDAAAAMATTTDSSYTVANTEWMAADGTPLAIGDKFQPGTVYTVKITLETAGAGVFSVKSTYNTIEGKTATVSPNLTGDNHADSVILTYTFDKTAGGYHPGTGTGTGATTYPITVKSAKNGDVTASHKTASKGTTVTLTVDPDKGYVLDTLTVLDGKDKELKLTEKNGKYTFTMPDSKVTVAATFKTSAPTGKNPFIDVPAGSYYEDAVIWAVDKGITTGTSATTFNPNGICTRAQAVTFLWRAAGSPAAKSSAMPFVDVKAGSYYYDAVLWAVEQGITKGTSDTMFSPDATCTRAQIVTFLWRANGSPVASGNSAFTDVASDAYYAAAVTWAEKNGVTGGIGGGLFGSNNNCTRAQIVTFIYRSMK